MSRYRIESVTPDQEVWVGWDASLETFFGHVIPKDEEYDDADDEALLLWVGTRLREVQTIEALQAALKPYAVMPLELVE